MWFHWNHSILFETKPGFKNHFAVFYWFQYGFIETILVSKWYFGPNMAKKEVSRGFVKGCIFFKVVVYFLIVRRWLNSVLSTYLYFIYKYISVEPVLRPACSLYYIKGPTLRSGWRFQPECVSRVFEGEGTYRGNLFANEFKQNLPTCFLKAYTKKIWQIEDCCNFFEFISKLW